MVELLWLILGITIGGLSAWLIAKYKFQNLNESASLRVYEQRIRELSGELDLARTELKREREKVITLSNRLSGNEAEYRHLEKQLTEQKAEIEKIQERFTTEFRNLAQDILEEKTRKFTEQNKVNLESLLNPLGEKISEFEKKVDQTNKEHIQWNSSLREQIRGLKELNQQITQEAENLTKALKGDSRVMGSWGEVILESILEKSGLMRDREYFVQKGFVGEDGRRYQPDVVIRLPENKNIVIDSKVILYHYERYVSSSGNDPSKSIHLKKHVQSLQKHIRDLSLKEYQNQYELEGLDFVLMFIPVEPAFTVAIQQDPDIFNEAYERNIVMVSPSTLIATLRTIANIWKNEYQNRNALEIARQGGDLFDKFVAFTEDLKNLGKHIDSTSKVYGDAISKLSEGRGNLVSRAKRIQELGAKTHKNLDPKLIDSAERGENE